MAVWLEEEEMVCQTMEVDISGVQLHKIAKLEPVMTGELINPGHRHESESSLCCDG